jgi:hypothetical protein
MWLGTSTDIHDRNRPRRAMKDFQDRKRLGTAV